jgi:hypothetical protein
MPAFLRAFLPSLGGCVAPAWELVVKPGGRQMCAGHVQQLGGESPLPNLMEVKG